MTKPNLSAESVRRPMHHHFGRELCEAWGLDPAQVAQIEVIVGPRECYANVTLYVNHEMSKKLLDLQPVQSDGSGGGSDAR